MTETCTHCGADVTRHPTTDITCDLSDRVHVCGSEQMAQEIDRLTDQIERDWLGGRAA